MPTTSDWPGHLAAWAPADARPRTDRLYRLIGAGFGVGIVVLAATLLAPFPNIEAGVIIVPHGIQSRAPSGTKAFAVAINGAEIDFGAGANDGATSDGTLVTFAGPLSTTALTTTGAASIGGALEVVSTLTVGDNADLLTDIRNTANGPVVINDDEGLRWAKKTLATCDGSLEWTVAADVASGASTGARSRLCVCTSDGAGSPAYAWQNIATANVGNTTTCPP